MKVEVAIVNAFTDGGKGGNPAGVVINADSLNESQKLAVAKKVGLSETAFVSKSKIADFKLDFYTPKKQIAHCGHATIATFSYLSQLGSLQNSMTSKETIDGRRDIQVNGDFSYMEQLAPKYISVIEKNAVLEALGISSDITLSDPMIVNTGNAFMLVGVTSREALDGLRPDHEIIKEISEKYGLVGFYVFTLEANILGRDASTRMFAPLYGITEEAATGMAAGPLACFLHDILKFRQTEFKIEQGYSMLQPSPSCIEVLLKIENGVINYLLAGGVGVVSNRMHVEI
ncbi:phenazine biosynthesis protein [Pseudoalteromonas aliena]|jgi:PhzF family phenazine biosynthesis protein|uniref:Phenazine biosynthesis protein n=1 Tax=Pseudoalteromonas aliena TaxID=247523 RepID=A0A1Q2H1K6_9GAMM|nr:MULTISPECIES: PhzF family phenazine biosynthesis protein [Pseudoalteromonas]AQQ01225.1 phenazine biosynthesis protein [Pseudoalteromonas aliena]